MGKRVVGCSITGLPEAAVENVTLENIRIQFKGGGTADDVLREIPEKPAAYPSCRMFGTLPAYGFFVRHAKQISFRNVDLSFEHDDVGFASLEKYGTTLRDELLDKARAFDGIILVVSMVDLNIDVTQTNPDPAFNFNESDFFVHAVRLYVQLNH